MKQHNKTKNALLILLALTIYTSFAIALGLFVFASKNYPQGDDIYGHIFKANVLYNAIKDGVWYPLYTNLWYNSQDLFRYWPPFAYYILAGINFITNGDVYLSYSIFVGVAFFVSACGWLLFGLRENKVFLASILGFIYFFLPDNMRVFFIEGNLPRITITALLPYLFFFLFEFVKYKKKLALIPLSIMTALVVFTHIMISAMVGIASFLVLLIYSITNKEFKASIIALATMVSSYLLMGIILVPSLIGGIATQNSSASISTSSMWSRDILLTLNPVYHANHLTDYYFGISIFIIIVVGLIIARKDIKPFFLTSLILYLGTSTTMVKLISMLPMGQALWMQRFIPIALTFFFIGVIYWKQCKKSFTAIFTIVIILDCVATLNFLNPNFKDDSVKFITVNNQDEFLDEYPLDKVEQETQNRFAFLDLSLTGSYPSFYLSRNLSNNESTKYLFGWAYQGAYTEKEIVKINEALENGYYNYMFDRLKELGCDTILVKKDEIGTLVRNQTQDEKENELFHFASLNGYNLINQTDISYLLKLDLDKNIKDFGTVTTYENIAIGDSAFYIAYLYPTFKVGNSIYIDDYSYEELSQYKKIFLSSFLYHDKTASESLLTKLSENGTSIYIDMNNIPINELTQKKEFFKVSSQFVTFTDSFPIIALKNGSQFKLPMQTNEYSNWFCAYLTGNLKNERSAHYSDGTDLVYYGTNDNGNIHFLGFNLLYYCVSDRNENLIKYFSEIFDMNIEDLPNRLIVPINVQYDYNKIVISSDYDNTNTNISNLQCFIPNKDIEEEHHLIKVSSGETIFDVQYSYFNVGLFVSIVGFVVLCIIGTFVHSLNLKDTLTNNSSNRIA